MKLAAEKHYETDLTEEQFKSALPKKFQGRVSPDLMKKVNQLVQEPSLREAYRDNLLSYTHVMQEGKWKIESYVDAVKFVSCKMLGMSDARAWAATFPDRQQHYTDLGSDPKHIASVVSAYRKGTLVNKILEQTLVPVHVMNMDIHQRAINKLADLMMNAKSEKVQSDSAAKLVDALKPPETQKIELDVGIKEDQAIKELRQSTLELVEQQKLMLKSGQMTPKEVAHSKLAVVSPDGQIIKEAENG